MGIIEQAAVLKSLQNLFSKLSRAFARIVSLLPELQPLGNPIPWLTT
jgi:hypothetical protein